MPKHRCPQTLAENNVYLYVFVCMCTWAMFSQVHNHQSMKSQHTHLTCGQTSQRSTYKPKSAVRWTCVVSTNSIVRAKQNRNHRVRVWIRDVFVCQIHDAQSALKPTHLSETESNVPLAHFWMDLS